MTTPTKPRPAERGLPDLDAEREVDLRRHWNALALRWWLPAAGVESRALGHYSQTLITNLEGLVKSEKDSLASLDFNAKTLQTALKGGGGLSTTDRLVLLGQLNGIVQQRLSVVDQLSTNQQQLALAQDVEAPQLI